MCLAVVAEPRTWSIQKQTIRGHIVCSCSRASPISVGIAGSSRCVFHVSKWLRELFQQSHLGKRPVSFAQSQFLYAQHPFVSNNASNFWILRWLWSPWPLLIQSWLRKEQVAKAAVCERITLIWRLMAAGEIWGNCLFLCGNTGRF